MKQIKQYIIATFALLALAATSFAAVSADYTPSGSDQGEKLAWKAGTAWAVIADYYNGNAGYVEMQCTPLLTATNPPVWKGWADLAGGIPSLTFEAATGEGSADNADTPTNQTFIAFAKLPGGFVEGSVVYPRLTWCQTSTNGYATGAPSNVVWSLEWMFASVNSSNSTTTTQYQTNATTGTNYWPQFTTWSLTNATGKVYDSLVMKVTRMQTFTASSRYTNDVAFLGFGVVAPVNRNASTTTTTK